MKVLFITNIPSPYRVDFFNEFGKLCELTVIFETGFSSERDESWKKNNFKNFIGIVLEGKKVATDRAFSPKIKKYLSSKEFDRIIISNIASPTGIFAITYLKLHRIPYWIEGDGAFVKEHEGIKRLLKKYLIKGAVGYFSTSDTHDRYYLSYGAKKDRIFRYPFTSLHNKDIIQSAPTYSQKLEMRSELNITEDKIVLTVGQFIKRKGFDLLLEAAADFYEDVGFYFVGGEPTDEYISLAKGKKNIHFIGFKSPDILKKYFLCADVFALPTREDIWGLVIGEAMASGLPIITTESCGAGLTLVKDGVNGYIIPVNDQKALTDRIRKALDSSAQMGNESLSIIRPYSIEKMAEAHMKYLNSI